MEQRIPADRLESFCTRVFRAAGLPEPDAALAAECLILANLRGIHSHGVSRLGTYARRIREGVVASDSTIEIVNDSPTALLVDGHNAMGTSVGRQVMGTCIDRARKSGNGFAAVRRSNHFGIGAFYTTLAAEQGLIGLTTSNAPASMVPFGGARPMLGTNPLSIAIPSARHPPLVLDMASSVVAQGKIILAKKQGETEIPSGWAVDADGTDTTDPQAALAGSMLPFGGPKGYAIHLSSTSSVAH